MQNRSSESQWGKSYNNQTGRLSIHVRMIDIIITSYNEPQATLRAVNAFLMQKSKEKIRITVIDPFPEVEKFLKKNIKDKRFTFYPDPGEGKSYALNLVFQEYASSNKD